MLSLNLRDTVSIGLRALSSQWREARDRALVPVALRLWDDANNIAPTPPILTGDLRASGSLFVGAKAIKTDKLGTTAYPGKDGTVTFGYNSDYAFWQHEMTPPVNYSNTSSKIGPDFLGSKLVRFGKDYFALFSREFDKELGRVKP